MRRDKAASGASSPTDGAPLARLPRPLLPPPYAATHYPSTPTI